MSVSASAGVDQRVEDDPRRLLDLPQRLLDLRLVAHQRMQMLDRMGVLVLRGDGAADADQRLAGGVGNEVEVEVALRDQSCSPTCA